MRPRTAAAVWGAAVVLGGAGGLLVPLADPGAVPSPAPAPRRATPTSTPSQSPSPSPSPSERLAEGDLLSVRSFADESVPVTYESQHGTADRTIDATSCVDDDVHQTGTLKKLTGHDPVLEGDWTQTDTGNQARQLVGVADDPADAAESVARLVGAMTSCQEAPPGHYVLGSASTESFSSTRSATWVGFYPADQNTSGRAPEGVEPCGGTVLARNGARFTTVTVSMCLDGPQLAGLARSASERLG